MYLGRVAGPYHMSLITPVIGAAKAALDEYQDIIRTKNTNFPPVTPRAEHEDFQRALGRATILADTAENLLIRGGEVYMEMCQRWASDGTLITVEQNLRLWAMLQQAGGPESMPTDRGYGFPGSSRSLSSGRPLRAGPVGSAAE
jgi:3-hydroxy-9,10-secoandrosta-1,3,5(10)-triene-9,17-dione monooxygenase